MSLKIKSKKKFVITLILSVFCLWFAVKTSNDFGENEVSLIKSAYDRMLAGGMKMYSPFLVYMDSDWKGGGIYETVWYGIWHSIPTAQFVMENYENKYLVSEYMQGTKKQIPPQVFDDEKGAEPSEPYGDAALWEAVTAENQAVNDKAGQQPQKEGFVKAEAPAATYSIEQLKETGFIKKTFYTEDPTTKIQENQVQYDTLMGFDAAIKQDNSLPQILVYHTHSQEAFINSDPNDISTTILGVGENLCSILRDEYGFNVIHHMGMYDVESRDYAYSNAMEGLEQVLGENPSIEVIIDLHRDEVKADTKLITTIQDIPMAKFMFFNGLSYSKDLGELTSLPNPYVQDNLSFAFQMQLAAEEYYPGIARRIYLKGYRYNLHYRPKSLLIELGAQTNTVEEAMNACGPLAHVISMVLYGENKTVY